MEYIGYIQYMEYIYMDIWNIWNILDRGPIGAKIGWDLSGPCPLTGPNGVGPERARSMGEARSGSTLSCLPSTGKARSGPTLFALVNGQGPFRFHPIMPPRSAPTL